jgi:Rieske Fe-S protein
LTIDNTGLEPQKYINRKTFIRLAATALALAFLALWDRLTSRQKVLLDRPVVTRLNAAILGTGTYLFERFIVVKSADDLKVFSNKCTHAGCRINQEMDGQLICPCHGSRYEAATGKVVQGPAGLDLPSVPFITDVKTGEIIIKV